MQRNRSLELHLTEAELETLINAVRSTSGGRLPELEFKLRAAWRRPLPQIWLPFDHRRCWLRQIRRRSKVFPSGWTPDARHPAPEAPLMSEPMRAQPHSPLRAPRCRILE